LRNPTSFWISDMTRDEAVQVALACANENLGFPTGDHALVLLPGVSVETEDGWWFCFDTRAYVETGDVDRMAPFGNVPIVVLKKDGSVHTSYALATPEEAILRGIQKASLSITPPSRVPGPDPAGN
jgi:hypothetical protein